MGGISPFSIEGDAPRLGCVQAEALSCLEIALVPQAKRQWELLAQQKLLGGGSLWARSSSRGSRAAWLLLSHSFSFPLQIEGVWDKCL